MKVSDATHGNRRSRAVVEAEERLVQERSTLHLGLLLYYATEVALQYRARD